MQIAVVIPALDEADRIESAIRTAWGSVAAGAHRERPEGGAGANAGDAVIGVVGEVVVVDGGSRDDTVARARRAGARVVESGRGRARQLEAGFRSTRGEVVMFLHADTQLAADWPGEVARALADPSVVGGAFRLRFDGDGAALRIVERLAALRVRWLGLPYGDQALFARRRTLEEIGGIPQVAVMEDVDLVSGLRARGRVVALAGAATTSARRYQVHGVLRTAGRHGIALVLWRLGVDRARIARWAGR